MFIVILLCCSLLGKFSETFSGGNSDVILYTTDLQQLNQTFIRF